MTKGRGWSRRKRRSYTVELQVPPQLAILSHDPVAFQKAINTLVSKYLRRDVVIPYALRPSKPDPAVGE